MSKQKNPFSQTREEYNARILNSHDLYLILLEANVKALEAECLRVMTLRRMIELEQDRKHPDENNKSADDQFDVKIPHFVGVATNIVSERVIESLKEQGFLAYHAVGDWLVIYLDD